MDKATLVDTELDKGLKALSALDRAGLNIGVALWATFPEYEEPRLVLASRTLDQKQPLDAYGVALDVLREEKLSGHRRPTLLILKMTDPFIRDLRRIFGRAADVEGMRLGGQSFGGRYISDAYVYRIK